jgi:Ala-tRNA(Pro) deacylase
MDIENFLKVSGVTYRKHEHPAAYTAQELAAEEHVSGKQVAKPVIVKADQRFVMCVLPAHRKIDMGKLAQGLSANRCELLAETEIARLFPDAEVGAEPPFGKPYGLQTVVDSELAGARTITFAAGNHHSAIQMAYCDYATLAEPSVFDFAAGE